MEFKYIEHKGTIPPVRLNHYRFAWIAAVAAIFLPLLCGAKFAGAQQSIELLSDSSALPDAPEPARALTSDPESSVSQPVQSAPPVQSPSSEAKPASSTNLDAAPNQQSTPPNDDEKDKKQCKLLPCPGQMVEPVVDWYRRFEDGPQVKALTPKEKAWLATRNLIDPFNLITILGEAGISVAANSHSAYGPGMPGYGRYVGVSFTQDLTGQFFGTFLIPSIVHQDPHYHREPKATIFHRSLHVVTQVVWTQGDNGKGMLNYANLAGFAIEDELGNLYVPGQRTNASATAQRYVIGLATAPIDNIITEFLPDVAKRIHIQVVVVQRIINHIANNNANGT
jgi:hypothetical protein